MQQMLHYYLSMLYFPPWGFKRLFWVADKIISPPHASLLPLLPFLPPKPQFSPLLSLLHPPTLPLPPGANGNISNTEPSLTSGWVELGSGGGGGGERPIGVRRFGKRASAGGAPPLGMHCGPQGLPNAHETVKHLNPKWKAPVETEFEGRLGFRSRGWKACSRSTHLPNAPLFIVHK